MSRAPEAIVSSTAIAKVTPVGRVDVAESQPSRSVAVAADALRVVARGNFLFLGGDKYWVRGVTYGTFDPDAQGGQFPGSPQVEHDFAQMGDNGINTVRVYTPPPCSLLDAALRHGLRVMVGLPWEQHVAFLDDAGRASDIVDGMRAQVRSSAGHPAVLCYAVGNEIPGSIVRWHGRRRVERFIHRLYDAVKQEDTAALVTYVNFPTTEYLQLPFLDFVCFNVYLESEERLSAYLARLQNQAGERPLVLAELGLDSRRNGEAAQAESLAWQLRTTFAEGCAGAFVFAWTDEWHRGGFEIDDWDFGLTRRDRQPKPALTAVRRAFSDVPFPADTIWPQVTVVVCSYNGARTIRDTLGGLQRLAYPNFDVIVVNDGSTDETPAIAAEYPVRIISTENRGLSAARNTGWQAASGEIVAYIDDDAYPDPHWLHYLAHRLMNGDWVGVGGPNMAPAGDGPIADCVANAPGGPVQVLISDIEAEHIPGCNMALRRDALTAVGGFDARFRTAGDDVDLCWRLQQRGGRIGFHAGAMDWHHRRNSVSMYWRQQKGYGKAESLLEEKWPERYNAAGHVSWGGRLYGRGFPMPISLRPRRVYGGVWGSAAYQSLYESGPLTLLTLPLMPEWHFVIAALALLSLLGVSWPPLFLALPLLLLALAAPLAQAAIAASRARYPQPAQSVRQQRERWALTFVLHLMQPMARLNGRIQHGLTPWRQRGASPLASPWRCNETLWSECWRDPSAWVEALEGVLRAHGAIVQRGSECDRWDLAIRGGVLAAARCRLAIEEHGAGRQLVRIACAARPSASAAALVVVFALLAVGAGSDSAWTASTALAGAALTLGGAARRQALSATGACRGAVNRLRAEAADALPARSDR